ncbi:MAG: hypothetical protein IPJ93_02420 [Bacteroidota bacterium]|nr:MAG: hypothetical protein IPJ93_02420 [Bacteroidota bacterium]
MYGEQYQIKGKGFFSILNLTYFASLFKNGFLINGMSTNKNETQIVTFNNWDKEQLMDLVSWLKTSQAKEAFTQTEEQRKELKEVIENMTQIDPKAIKEPYTI